MLVPLHDAARRNGVGPLRDRWENTVVSATVMPRRFRSDLTSISAVATVRLPSARHWVGSLCVLGGIAVARGTVILPTRRSESTRWRWGSCNGSPLSRSSPNAGRARPVHRSPFVPAHRLSSIPGAVFDGGSRVRGAFRTLSLSRTAPGIEVCPDRPRPPDRAKKKGARGTANVRPPRRTRQTRAHGVTPPATSVRCGRRGPSRSRCWCRRCRPAPTPRGPRGS